LGDVVSGLGKALQKKGHLVEIVLPKYDCMQYDRVCNLRVCYFIKKITARVDAVFVVGILLYSK